MIWAGCRRQSCVSRLPPVWQFLTCFLQLMPQLARCRRFYRPPDQRSPSSIQAQATVRLSPNQRCIWRAGSDRGGVSGSWSCRYDSATAERVPSASTGLNFKLGHYRSSCATFSTTAANSFRGRQRRSYLLRLAAMTARLTPSHSPDNSRVMISDTRSSGTGHGTPS